MNYLGWAGITAGILAGWLVLGLVVALMFHTWKRAVIMADRHVDWRKPAPWAFWMTGRFRPGHRRRESVPEVTGGWRPRARSQSPNFRNIAMTR